MACLATSLHFVSGWLLIILQSSSGTASVLLSRARKGCFVYFMDKETEKFFRSRTASNPSFIEIACLSAVLWVVLLSRVAKIFGLPLLGVP